MKRIIIAMSVFCCLAASQGFGPLFIQSNGSALGSIAATGTLNFTAGCTKSGTTFTCGSGSSASLPYVTPEASGAKGDGAYYFDGSITPSTNTATGTSPAPATPATATITNGSVVDYDFQTNAAWSAVPATGTNLANIAFTTGQYGLYLNSQTIATAGSVGAVSGTLASSTAWNTAVIINVPSGGTITTVGTPTTVQTTGNATVTTPTGAATGDTLIAYVHHFGNGVTPPAGWTTVQNVADGGGDRLEVDYLKLSGSPAANYTWTNSSSGISVAMVARSNVGSVQALSTLTSATANFASTVGGDPICTAATGAASAQQCGQIEQYLSSSSVTVNYVAAATPSNIWFGFGTDDSGAFTTMLTSAPCSTVGCRVLLGPNGYVLTTGYTLPPNRAIQFVGAGAAMVNTANSYKNGNTLPNANTGSRLMYLTTNLSGPAIKIGGTAGVTSTTAFDLLSDMSLFGGAGNNRDGGGGDGVDILNWQGAAMQRVTVANFSGIGVYVDGVTASSFKDYLEDIALNQVYVLWNGAAGFQEGSSTAVDNLEAVSFTNGISESNNGPGIVLEGNVQGFTALNNTIQWNNVNGVVHDEIQIVNNVHACSITDNYIEVDISGELHGITPSTSGCNVFNYIAGNSSPYDGRTGINTTSPTGYNTVGGSFVSPPYAVPYSTTPALNLDSSNTIQFACTTAGAAISPTVSNLHAGELFTVIFVQNGTTACTWTWPSNIHGGGTVPTGLSHVGVQSFVVSNNGTDAYSTTTMQDDSGGTP